VEFKSQELFHLGGPDACLQVDLVLDSLAGISSIPVLLLYPAHGAVDIREAVRMDSVARRREVCGPSRAQEGQYSYHLLVIDGTWRQAREMFRGNYEALFGPRVMKPPRCVFVDADALGSAFPPHSAHEAPSTTPSAFGTLRKQPEQELCMTTMEAVGLAVSLAEPGETGGRIIRAVDDLVNYIVQREADIRRHLPSAPSAGGPMQRPGAVSPSPLAKAEDGAFLRSAPRRQRRASLGHPAPAE